MSMNYINNTMENVWHGKFRIGLDSYCPKNTIYIVGDPSIDGGKLLIMHSDNTVGRMLTMHPNNIPDNLLIDKEQYVWYYYGTLCANEEEFNRRDKLKAFL